MDKQISLKVNGTPLTFNMSLGIYNRYLNELQPTNKVAPATNLLTRTVDTASKAALQEMLQLPGMSVLLASALIEHFTPDIEIELGE